MWLIVKAMNLASVCSKEELLFDKMPVRCLVFFVVPFCVQNLMSLCTISIISIYFFFLQYDIHR